jgi:hypothetical protein
MMHPCCEYNFTLVCSTPSIAFPYPFPPSPHYSTIFHTYCYILYLYRCYVLHYCWCSVILFSFSSTPEFHRAVPLLETCSTCKFVYDHVCFVYMFICWVYLPHMRENMWPLSFWNWLTSFNMMSSKLIHEIVLIIVMKYCCFSAFYIVGIIYTFGLLCLGCTIWPIWLI